MLFRKFKGDMYLCSINDSKKLANVYRFCIPSPMTQFDNPVDKEGRLSDETGSDVEEHKKSIIQIG